MSVDSYVIEETKSKEELDKLILDLTDEVDRLYIFRDHYFENHSIEKAVDKDSDVKKQLETALSTFEKCEESSISDVIKANFLYLKGRALNILPKYDQKAMQALSKAVKLDPKLVDAWNELGECYWKDNNLPEAKNCFSGALPHKRNKVSLRNMSIVLRQEVSTSSQERQKNIDKSVELAKEAVQLDPKDGVSWCILGNAYLCSFFVIAQDPNILKLCMRSYRQALNDPIARGQSDLHYNRAIALIYEEEFSQALDSFSKAIALDPTWEDPPIEMQKLLSYIQELDELAKTKGKIKGKRLQQMIQQLDNKQMGPYSDGKYTSGNQSIKLERTPLADLKVEMNPEIVILGKVVCSIRNERTVPFTFCIVDSQGTCMAVTVYNLADGKGVIIGDTIAIPEPFVTHQCFTYKDKEYKFESIRVDNPMVMVVNGKKVGKDQMAGTRITSYYKAS